MMAQPDKKVKRGPVSCNDSFISLVCCFLLTVEKKKRHIIYENVIRVICLFTCKNHSSTTNMYNLKSK